tara:strand:- start:29 stop:166 length:138 start_codon:yes stop_codon:yes gene_type:complete
VLVEQVYNHQLMELLLITLLVVGEYEVITIQPLAQMEQAGQMQLI